MQAASLELALAGHSYDEIALEVGYQSGGTREFEVCSY